jgi:hypothetical protein
LVGKERDAGNVGRRGLVEGRSMILEVIDLIQKVVVELIVIFEEVIVVV